MSDTLPDRNYVVEIDDEDDMDVDVSVRASRNRLAVNFDVPEDDEFPLEVQARWFERFSEGYQEWEIGLEFGWSMAKINRFTNNEDRASLMWMMRERRLEGHERALEKAADSGNVAALRLVLFNKGKHRGWSDTRHVHVEAQSQREIIVSVRQAIDERITQAALTEGHAGIAAIQAAFLDGPDDFDDAIEARVVGET